MKSKVTNHEKKFGMSYLIMNSCTYKKIFKIINKKTNRKTIHVDKISIQTFY